ncbi:Superfamily II DNA and RNA helicase [Reichenbachiella faecimaris]|uniref:Superfamily II DNA and RNA helicase n=1 Tax=Reichenbachiella faecimaris TaxID=692418 RepID=A0A1W2G6D7_REIFA|nr:DEAD/DEAH box helicase [Reichenbachiella faecimaris]SMD32240.1 Superfamily II DNA and RNA helicase [Reichenbachiella faecimaris]
MSGKIKDQKAILEKLGIAQLNTMQLAAQQAISENDEVVLLSPTGTGKTLAFLLPIIANLDPNLEEAQVLILVPSRELAIQIEQVVREMGSGFKANAVYGGRAGSKDKTELKHAPAILIGTPGRIADHFRRETISTDYIDTIVLDEFDKSLEVGFETEMIEIIDELRTASKKILTSATQKVEIPAFVGLKNPTQLDFLDQPSNNLSLKLVTAKPNDKLAALVQLLEHVQNGNGIIFCNFKDTIQEVSDYLMDRKIGHSCFYGGLEQQDRERALIKFRNGTSRLLLATDLAARGIDVPALDFIVHFQLPPKEEEFTHRNGRTARMSQNGTSYLLKSKNEKVPDFAKGVEEEILQTSGQFQDSPWCTLFISGGRKDKISKGDIAGLFMKQGSLTKDELGMIELKQDCAFVAVPASKSDQLIKQLNNSRLKKKKVRISLLK